MSDRTALVYRLTPSETDPVRQLQRRLGASIRRFAEQRSRSAAGAVVDTLGQLCHHPSTGFDTQTRWELLRLRAHWQKVAFVTRAG